MRPGPCPAGWGDYSLAASLESFQNANNLKVDGYANPDGETMRALAPYAQRIAAKEGEGETPKDPPKDDKPKPPPPANLPEDEKPKEPPPSSADDPCRDLWWDHRADIEVVQPLDEASLKKSDDVKRRMEAIANLKEDKLPAAVTVMRDLVKLTPATRAALMALDAAIAAKQALENSKKRQVIQRLEAELSQAQSELEEINRKLATDRRQAEKSWNDFCNCRKSHGYRC
ncbi:MAG: peptidoglycan-binding domain-containing protein [Rhodospirillales bacterium]|nr:peptidoglycan-binding domain-containing protein [Rhodospirillales bacterium]